MRGEEDRIGRVGEGVYVPVWCDCASVTLNLSFDKRFQCRAGRWLHSEGGGGGVIIITDLLFVPVHCSLPANTSLNCHTKNDDGSTST